VDGQPPTGRESLGGSIGPGQQSYSRPVDSAASSSGCWRTPATSDWSTSSNGTCPSRTSYQSPLRSSPPSCRAWSRLSRMVAIVGWLGGGWLGRSPGALVVGAGAGQIAEADEHGAEAAVPSGRVSVVGTVGGRVDVSRRHGCGCAIAKAPGRGPEPCCWPPRVPDNGRLLLSLQGTTVSNSAEVRRREPRFREPRSRSVEPTADPATCDAAARWTAMTTATAALIPAP
jgi:hypothetical protein